MTYITAYQEPIEKAVEFGAADFVAVGLSVAFFVLFAVAFYKQMKKR